MRGPTAAFSRCQHAATWIGCCCAWPGREPVVRPVLAGKLIRPATLCKAIVAVVVAFDTCGAERSSIRMPIRHPARACARPQRFTNVHALPRSAGGGCRIACALLCGCGALTRAVANRVVTIACPASRRRDISCNSPPPFLCLRPPPVAVSRRLQARRTDSCVCRRSWPWCRCRGRRCGGTCATATSHDRSSCRFASPHGVPMTSGAGSTPAVCRPARARHQGNPGLHPSGTGSALRARAQALSGAALRRDLPAPQAWRAFGLKDAPCRVMAPMSGVACSSQTGSSGRLAQCGFVQAT